MSSIASSAVSIQTSPESVQSTPSWLGEVVIVAHYLRTLGVLEKIVLEVRFARRRFGTYDTIDFICVLIGYALSREATLKEFYERLTPFATTFMRLFGREELPSRYALSRYLSAVDQSTVEILRALFAKDLVSRPLDSAARDDRGPVGPMWREVVRLRYRCNATACSTASLAPHQSSPTSSSSYGCGLCSWIYRAQTR